jgi:hypothetical protein
MVVMIMLVLSLAVVGFMLFIGTAEPKDASADIVGSDAGDSGDGGGDGGGGGD